MIDKEQIDLVSEKLTSDIYKSVDEESQVDRLFRILLYSVSDGNDAKDLFNLLGMENFVTLISYFNGKRIRTIRRDKLEEIMRTAVLFNEVNFNGLSWDGVRKKYPEWKIDANKERFRIKKLEDTIRKSVNGILQSEKGE